MQVSRLQAVSLIVQRSVQAQNKHPVLCRAYLKGASVVQDVAADQALMQLMDARGTLLELKVRNTFMKLNACLR